jgi:hypothetical protein
MCDFSLPFTGTNETLINKARQAVIDAGGKFDGDINAGTFTVKVKGIKVSGSYTGTETTCEFKAKASFPPAKLEGSYTLNGATIHFVFTKIPGLINCDQIKEALENIFKNDISLATV